MEGTDRLRSANGPGRNRQGPGGRPGFCRLLTVPADLRRYPRGAGDVPTNDPPLWRWEVFRPDHGHARRRGCQGGTESVRRPVLSEKDRGKTRSGTTGAVASGRLAQTGRAGLVQRRRLHLQTFTVRIHRRTAEVAPRRI